jgi:hypothetical protein
MLCVSDRTFRRYIDRYHHGGLDGLLDKRLTQASARKAPVDEAMELVERYQSQHKGWNVSHFHSWYRRDGGTRSYTWVKNQLQTAKAVPKGKKRGAHRKKRERAPLPGMMIHQDGSTHEWVPDKKWDLIVTMDDATNEHYSMFFTDAPPAALPGSRRSSSRAACSAPSIAIGAVTTGIRPRPVARSTKKT